MTSALLLSIAFGHPIHPTEFPALRNVRIGLHRGGYSDWPESTVYGFTKASEISTSILLETDATTTADGEVVLLHDDTVDRTTNGTGPIKDKTLAEVKALDAGYRFKSKGGEFPFRGKGLTIPTLSEALRAAPKSVFLIDLKPACDVKKVADVIRTEKAQDRVIFASFLPAKMSQVRNELPKVATCYDSVQGAKLLFALRSKAWETYQPEAPMLSLMTEHVDQYKITPDEIKRITAKGIHVQIHTLANETEITKWERQGVSGWLTGNLEAAKKFLLP